MKRMYVVLGLMSLFIFWTGSLLGQNHTRPVDDGPMDSLEKRMKLREEMHRRMVDKLLKGFDSDEEIFSDMEKMMDEIMTDSFNGMGSFSRMTSQDYKIEWNETNKGRTLVITPNTPEQKLEINIADGLIEIKGKTEQKTAGRSFLSNFSNNFNVPGDCDPSKVKMEQKDGKILVFFPYRAVKAVDLKPKQEDRVPIPPSDSDIQI